LRTSSLRATVSKSCKTLSVSIIHHPGQAETRAPAYSHILDTGRPVMPTTVASEDLLYTLSDYFMEYQKWVEILKMYPESWSTRKSEFHLYFIDGLLPVMKWQIFLFFDETIVLLSQNPTHLVNFMQKHSI
jgi:hypothetical protein